MAWLFDPTRNWCIYLFLLMGAVFTRLDSPFEPTVWRHATDLPPLEGGLARNDRLAPAEHLSEDVLIGPEAFAIGNDGYVYTGLWDGTVVRLDKNGESPKGVFFTGGFVSPVGRAVASINGLDYETPLLRECQAKAREKKLSLKDERQCGRPLGLKFRSPTKLYVLDAYHGLFEIDLAAGGKAKQLINALTDKPLLFGKADNGRPRKHMAAGVAAEEVEKPLLFLNDLLFTKGGFVFLTDSSWKHPRAYNRREIIDGAPRGRLLRYDLASGDLRTVMCGLHFPNGLELDRSGTKLLVVESLRFRVLEVDLEGLLARDPRSRRAPPSASALADALCYCGERDTLPEGVDVFADSLPGFVDGMVYDEEHGGYICAAGTKVAHPFSALHLALKHAGWIRTLIGKLIPLGFLDKLVPQYGMLVILREDGSVKESMQDPTGRTAFVSAAHRHPESGFTFLGSSQNPYLGRVRL